MTHRQKISLGLYLIILIAILLSLTARAQFSIKFVSGTLYSRMVRTNGVVNISDSVISIHTNYETRILLIKKKFEVKGRDFYELDTMGAKTFLFIESRESDGCRVGDIVLSERFRKKPERVTRYKFKNLL
jgi:hypothetical protein